MMQFRTRMAISAALAAAALGAAANVGAQAYPTKPIRLVVPFPPGGSNDVIARIVGPKMAATLGQQIVIDNRPGAGSTIGADNVAKSPADGYSMIVTQASFATTAATRAKLPYDPLKDFAPIGLMAKSPTVMVVHPSMPVKSAKDLIDLARARPGEILYGTSGIGGSNHLATELLSRMAKIRMIHVPFKGIGPALTDLMGGHVQVVITSFASGWTHVQSGRLRAVAIAGEKRTKFAPHLPTITETAVPGYVANLWWGLSFPAKTPGAIIDKVTKSLAGALKDPEVERLLATTGTDPTYLSPADFDKYIRDEIALWRKTAREANIKAQ